MIIKAKYNIVIAPYYMWRYTPDQLAGYVYEPNL